jgi:hypothetical protein
MDTKKRKTGTATVSLLKDITTMPHTPITNTSNSSGDSSTTTTNNLLSLMLILQP